MRRTMTILAFICVGSMAAASAVIGIGNAQAAPSFWLAEEPVAAQADECATITTRLDGTRADDAAAGAGSWNRSGSLGRCNRYNPASSEAAHVDSLPATQPTIAVFGVAPEATPDCPTVSATSDGAAPTLPSGLPQNSLRVYEPVHGDTATTFGTNIAFTPREPVHPNTQGDRGEPPLGPAITIPLGEDSIAPPLPPWSLQANKTTWTADK